MKYQKIKDYDGGGVILNAWTSIENIRVSCTDDIYDEVLDLIGEGKEVIILHDEIKAVSG